MAACGVPMPNQNHALTMLQFAKSLYVDLAEYNKNAKIKFQIRIGICTGPVVVGVIGKNKLIYDLWGDIVNTASRMETVCTPGKIRITESVKNSIDYESLSGAISEVNCEIKGKGMMHTYEL